MSVDNLPVTLDLDTAASVVEVSAGLRYGDVASYLAGHGYALANLASLPHISIAGACATGTHGSGSTNPSLASAVKALQFVTATGEAVTLQRGDEDFSGAVVSLGALGIVTSLTLDVVPAFDMRQYVYRNMPEQQVRTRLDDVLDSAYSVSVMTTWRGDGFASIWLKESVDEQTADRPASWYGATLADVPCHPVPGASAANCTEQMGAAGPAHERLPHFRNEFVPSSGDELQSEFLLPRERALDALDVVAAMAPGIAKALLVCEIRTVASDDLWLSPSYGRDTIAFHFTWMNDVDAVARVLYRLEDGLSQLGSRPHWGKIFLSTPRSLAEQYPCYERFRALRRRYDPNGKFSNEFLDRYFAFD